MKKKNYSYIGISFIILIFGMYVIPKVFDKFKGESSRLFKNEKNKVPDFEFTNQDGRVISNKDYQGKVYVVEFFFTTCPTICPEMNKQMLTLQKAFSVEANFGIASITIDPDNDTQSVLKVYAKKYGVKSKNWHFLTGKSSDYVYALSNKGFNLYAGKGDVEKSKNHAGFEHSGLFALVDENGFIRSRFDEYGNPIIYYRALSESGFPDQMKELKEDIKLLLNE